jgi:hypothetical protein
VCVCVCFFAKTLLVCLSTAPPPGKRRLVIATTARADQLEQLEITRAFDVEQELMGVSRAVQFSSVLRAYLPGWSFSDAHITAAVMLGDGTFAIKHLLQAVDMAVQKTLKQAAASKQHVPPKEIPLGIWHACLSTCAVR